ncbi:MAG: SulP family inorganic anion transporter [Microbacteriaceae bacterium]|nr:SulP family inorganic anion transporter [Microbacteriaceae bacterium]
MNRFWKSAAALLPSPADYRLLKTSWASDIVAGITVGIVALPLSLAFGISSGVGAEAGLITAIIAGLVAAIFGGSNVQVSGPTGAMVVVLLPIVALHGPTAVATVSLLAGIAVVIAGVLKLGRLVSFIPWPVIEGFTVGIGIIIFLQQVPGAVGVNPEGHSTNAVIATFQAIFEASWPAAFLPLAVVAVTALLIVMLEWKFRKLPASFIAIVLVSIGVYYSGLPLETIGELPKTLPAPTIPMLDWHTMATLIGPALAVAALAAIESLLSARVAAGMSRTGPYHADRELVGQGLASIASGMFGGMPATGAITRTAVNIRSGARTRMASIVHAITLLGVVFLAANIVEKIPLAALAGVLMVTAARMVSIKTITKVMRVSRADALVGAATTVVTVSFDLVVAVGIGILAAAFFALRAMSATSGVTREDLSGDAQPGDERIALFRIDGALFFGVADKVLEEITSIRGIEVVILRLSQIQHIDSTGAHTLTDIINALEGSGVTVLVKGVRPAHIKIMERLGVMSALRHPNHLFTELAPAIEHARSHVGRDNAS